MTVMEKSRKETRKGKDERKSRGEAQMSEGRIESRYFFAI